MISGRTFEGSLHEMHRTNNSYNDTVIYYSRSISSQDAIWGLKTRALPGQNVGTSVFNRVSMRRAEPLLV